MAASDARPVPRKNVAFRVTFPILDADGDLVTGAAGLDSEVSLDGAAFADATSEATEIATSSGMYFLDLTAAEMNADTVAIIVKTSTAGAKTTPIVLYPEEVGDFRVNVEQFGGTNGTFAAGRPEVNTSHVAGTAQTAGDVIADTNDIQARLPAALVGGRIDASVGSYPGNTAQTGDSFARLGAPAGASVSADVAAVQADTDNLQTRVPAALVAGRMDASVGSVASGAITAAAIADGAIDAATFAAGAVDAAALAADAANEIADALLDRASALDTKTVRQALRYIAAVCAGKISGATPNGGTETFVGLDGVTNRVTSTVDKNGNRSAITYD